MNSILKIGVSNCRRKKAYLTAVAAIALVINSTSTFGQSGLEAKRCLSVDTSSNSLTDFWVNSCGARVSVKWFDSGNCRNGCGDEIGAGDRSTKIKQKGEINWAACFSPSFPRDYDGPGDRYNCD